jgi:hypothetical protein
MFEKGDKVRMSEHGLNFMYPSLGAKRYRDKAANKLFIVIGHSRDKQCTRVSTLGGSSKSSQTYHNSFLEEVKTKIYLASFPDGSGGFLGQALAEDGLALASHLSSSVDWAKHDMGFTSDCRHDTYTELYPHGYELIWIDDPHTDERWRAALALNKAAKE